MTDLIKSLTKLPLCMVSFVITFKMLIDKYQAGKQ